MVVWRSENGNKKRRSLARREAYCVPRTEYMPQTPIQSCKSTCNLTQLAPIQKGSAGASDWNRKIASAHCTASLGRDTETQRHRQTLHRRSDTHTRPPSCCSCRGLSRIASSCCFAASVRCHCTVLVTATQLVACMHQQIKARPTSHGYHLITHGCCLRCLYKYSTIQGGIPYLTHIQHTQ